MDPDSDDLPPDGPPPGPPPLRRQNARYFSVAPVLLYAFDPRRCLVAAPPRRPAFFSHDCSAEDYAERRPLPRPLMWIRVRTESQRAVDFFAARLVCFAALMAGAGQ